MHCLVAVQVNQSRLSRVIPHWIAAANSAAQRFKSFFRQWAEPRGSGAPWRGHWIAGGKRSKRQQSRPGYVARRILFLPVRTPIRFPVATYTNRLHQTWQPKTNSLGSNSFCEFCDRHLLSHVTVHVCSWKLDPWVEMLSAEMIGFCTWEMVSWQSNLLIFASLSVHGWQGIREFMVIVTTVLLFQAKVQVQFLGSHVP